MHNKTTEQIEINDEHRGMRKTKSTSSLSSPSKKKFNHIEPDETNKPSSNGNSSPNQRRRAKRSSINNNSLLSTISTVHELMSFIIHKDDPPVWLKQTDIYREFQTKSDEIHRENPSDESHRQYYQQQHRKQSSNLHLYARSSQSWQTTIENHSNETETNVNQSPKLKSPSKTLLTRRQHMLCRKKQPENSPRRRPRLNSVENREPSEKRDSSSTNDSNTSSSSIEHASPSPTTTVSASSSHQSSPRDCMRANTSVNTPLRIQTSISPTNQTSTPQRRSTRTWAPSNFFVDPVWIIPNSTSPSSPSSSSKRLLVQNSDESNKRPRRRCRS